MPLKKIEDVIEENRKNLNRFSKYLAK